MGKTTRIILLVLMLIGAIFSTSYAQQNEFVRWGRTNIDSEVNVRTGPSTSHDIVGKLLPTDAVEVMNIDSNGWYLIFYEGKISYVHSKYINTWEECDYERVGSYKTYFNFNNPNRSHNIILASQQICVRLRPGEYFKWSEVIGPASKEQGYLQGNVIINGKMSQDYGGGVCQVSSTLYNAALEAGLEIVERHTHALPVGYVPTGRDATVSYGLLDFVFKNNKPYDIQITAFTGNGFVEVSMYNTNRMKKQKSLQSKETRTNKYVAIETVR